MNLGLLKNAILSGYDFTDSIGGSGSTVSRNIRTGTLQSTVSKIATPFFGRGKKTETLTFRFLPYSQGDINYCESSGYDVLSAYFSGCIMARYKQGDEWRVCHVSTGGPNDCKKEWEAIKSRPEVSNVSEFKPSDYNQTSQKVLGLITRDGKGYSIGCDPIPNPKGGQMLLKVNKLKQVF